VRRILGHRLLIAGVVVAFAAGGGVAYAATQSSSNPRKAFVNDVAKRLHVSPQRLTSAIKAAEIDRLNAAVKDGRLTQAQANTIKHAIETKGPPFIPGLRIELQGLLSELFSLFSFGLRRIIGTVSWVTLVPVFDSLLWIAEKKKRKGFRTKKRKKERLLKVGRL
jgi:hypothetical protein